METQNDDQIIEPYILLDKKGFRIIITGISGAGKTTLTGVLTSQFIKNYPKFKLFIVSQKNYKEDPNLKNFNFIQIFPKKNIKNKNKNVENEENNDEIYNLNNYRNSLFVFDDNDTNMKDNGTCTLINKITECGRSYNINIIFISHIHSAKQKTMIYGEPDIYISFKKSLKKNRMLENLEIDKEIIDLLKSENTSYICFNLFFNYLITDKFVLKIKEL